jgi:hypothetical protein
MRLATSGRAPPPTGSTPVSRLGMRAGPPSYARGMAVTHPHIRDGRPVGLLLRACLTTTACLVGLVLMATVPWTLGGAVILETVIANSL